jgi:hypothetical protein
LLSISVSYRIRTLLPIFIVKRYSNHHFEEARSMKLYILAAGLTLALFSTAAAQNAHQFTDVYYNIGNLETATAPKVVVLSWSLDAKPLSQKVEAELFTSNGAIGGAPVSQLPAIKENSDTSFTMSIPIGSPGPLDLTRYSTFKYRIQATFQNPVNITLQRLQGDTGASTTSNVSQTIATTTSLWSPYVSINLSYVKAAIDAAAAAAHPPRPINISPVKVSALDDSITLGVTTARPGLVRARAYRGTSLPNEISNPDGKAQTYVQVAQGTLTISPLLSNQPYVVVFDELDTSEQPVAGSETTSYTSLGGVSIATQSTIPHAVVSIAGDIIAQPTCILVPITLRHAKGLYYQVLEKDPRTGWVSPSPSTMKPVSLSVGSEYINTQGDVSTTITAPFKPAPDPGSGASEPYQLVLTAQSEAGDKYGDTAAPRVFHGYPPNIADNITVTVMGDGLQISANVKQVFGRSDRQAQLLAKWTAGTDPQEFTGLARSATPSIKLPFASMGTSGTQNGLPTLYISLNDPVYGIKEEADIKLVVDPKSTDPKDTAKKSAAVKSDIQQAQQTGNDTGSASNPKFSWKDLAKTGLGALIKYFAIAAL